MKKVLSIVFAVLCISCGAKFAHAANVSDYINITSFTSASSSISITWDKATTTLPDDEAVYLSAHGAGNLAWPVYLISQNGFYLDSSLGGITVNQPTRGGPCVGGVNTFTSASSTGNEASFTSLADGAASSSINILDLSTGDSIFAVLVSATGGNSCGPSTGMINGNFIADSYVGAVGTSYAASTTVAFLYPTESSTISSGDGQFGNWRIGAYNLTPGLNYNVMINSQLIGSSIAYVDSLSFEDHVVNTSGTVPMTNNMTNGDWAAEAFLYQGADLVASTSVNFTIGSTTASMTSPNCNFTSSTFLFDPVGNIKQGICAAFIWAFIPPNNLISGFANLEAPLAHKPPFGYFTSIYTSFTSLQIASSTTSTQLLSSAGATAFGGAFGSLDAGIAVILWVQFGFYVYHRFSNLEFS